MLVGIEIGGTKLQIVTASEPGRIASRWRGAVDKSAGGAGIQKQIAGALTEIQRNSPRPIEAAGVGFGGPVDIAAGAVRTSHQIDGWENFPLRDWVADRVSAPTRVDNDANVAALGEALRGAGAGADPVFYVTLGSGVGGGLVSGGAVYHGAAPGEAEFGHLRLDRAGATVESRCSGWAIDRRIASLADREPHGALARLTHGSTTGQARHLAEALADGDAACRDLLAELAGDLAFALSHVVHLMHPKIIVLGGGLSLLGRPLTDSVAAALPAFVMRAFWPAPAVKLAGLGEDSVPLGAIELANAAFQSHHRTAGV